MKDNSQPELFDQSEIAFKWEEEWQNMPEFIQEDAKPIQQIIVSFETREDVLKFAELVGQKITYKTKSIWFPQVQKDKPSDYLYIAE